MYSSGVGTGEGRGGHWPPNNATGGPGPPNNPAIYVYLFKEMKEDKHFLANMTIKFMCVFVFVNCIVVYWINVILGHPSNTLGPPQSTIAFYSTV